ncbi:CRISPR-associated protein Csx16 [Zoogloea sp.]|jgi:CRISPR-associated protein Csx16|uniref:CRISPR-associated protein Csx16 n=1 Tax=Zoogloea sp. TaxID=49181 RepID=UPI001E1ABEAE|nr:CRISPR-associated protein Csx16 [Zoogloea sp.]MBK6653975.1 CRISPR-associated protein Csx16 [Zoogloea sp.]MBK7847401.1 CRISPR-associated protein Csx16 [Zoogloea sp.]
MTVWFVSRHPGALAWAERSGIAFDHHVAHLDTATIAVGDTVIGSRPVNLAAEVCARGGEYWNLSLRLAAEDRRRELSADEMQSYDVTLKHCDVRKLP